MVYAGWKKAPVCSGGGGIWVALVAQGWHWWHLDSRYELLTLHDKDTFKIS